MNKRNIIALVVIMAIAIVGTNIGNIKAYLGQEAPKVVVEGDYIEAPAPVVSDAIGQLGAYIASPTTFTDVHITNDLVVDEIATLGIITYGSESSASLTVTAGATTTPGGLFAIQNTGEDRICQGLELEVNTNSSGNSCGMQFNVGTSTSATAWSASGGAIIASSTLPTTTTALWNDTDNTGTNTQDSWLWKTDEYLLGAFDNPTIGGVGDSASSTCYSSMVGAVYANCHTR